MERSFEIESDALDIVGRLKSIDRDYFVMFNPDRHKFEVHSHGQKNTYCLTVPYDALDERTITFVLKTRVQNSDKLFEEMERENLKWEKSVAKQVLSDLEEKFYDS